MSEHERGIEAAARMIVNSGKFHRWAEMIDYHRSDEVERQVADLLRERTDLVERDAVERLCDEADAVVLAALSNSLTHAGLKPLVEAIEATRELGGDRA